jgi:hypothetical protein
MDRLPESCDLTALGLDPAEVTAVTQIHERHGNRLFRIVCAGQPFVLKWFHDPATQTEVRSYALLEELGVPTLPVYGRAQDALLIEDLANSLEWRLAGKDDVELPQVGAAVAEWYRMFHTAGRRLFSSPAPVPAYLGREVDSLDAETVLSLGEKLGLSDLRVWAYAAGQIERLKGALAALPQTLNYNDFFWGNLALSRGVGPLRAVVFDYHLLGVGVAYSDCRNVVGSLGEGARPAFWEAYGPADEKERLLDEPTATLYGLFCATKRPAFPAWAQQCLDQVLNGDLERSLNRALEIVPP